MPETDYLRDLLGRKEDYLLNFGTDHFNRGCYITLKAAPAAAYSYSKAPDHNPTCLLMTSASHELNGRIVFDAPKHATNGARHCARQQCAEPLRLGSFEILILLLKSGRQKILSLDSCT